MWFETILYSEDLANNTDTIKVIQKEQLNNLSVSVSYLMRWRLEIYYRIYVDAEFDGLGVSRRGIGADTEWDKCSSVFRHYAVKHWNT